MGQFDAGMYSKLIKPFGKFSILDYLSGNKIITDNLEKYGENIVSYEKNLVNELYGNKFIGRCAAEALSQGYFSASMGMASAAFESSRFFLERMALLGIIKYMGLENNPYETALELREWHKLVDAKFIIYGFTQFNGRLKHYYGSNYNINEYSLYVTGVPLCGIHSKNFKRYSKEISEINKNTGIKIEEKCARCNRKATRFVISLPKAGALLTILGSFTGVDTSMTGKIYADYSRVIHPYGFYSYPKNYLKNLWTIDIIRLILIINGIIKDLNKN